MNVTRWGTFIYIMVCLTISTNIQAQENRAPLLKQVRITNTLFSIDSLSTLITVQTGVFLSYNSNKIATGKKIVTQKRSYAVEELLELIKSNTGSGYKIYKDHVIFHGGDKIKGTVSGSTKPTSKKEGIISQTASVDVDKTNTKSASTAKIKPPSVAKSTSTYIEKTGKSSSGNTKTNPISPFAAKKANTDTISLDKSSQSSAKSITIAETKPRTASVDKTNAESSATTETKNTTSNQSTTTNPFPLEPLKPKQMLKPSITLLLKPAIMAQRPTPSPQKTRWFADGGFTADDVLYLNASITAGHKYLHGFFSWSSSFKVSGFRYGLGSMVPLNDEWRIGMLVTTGKLNRSIDFSGVRDTLKNITVKSELHRLAIQVEKSLRPNLVVKAGPVFNLLKSSYYQDGTPVTVATSGYEGTNGDREFYTVRPLYTLSNSYKDTESTNTKTWIGFQVSLCYRFNF